MKSGKIIIIPRYMFSGLIIILMTFAFLPDSFGQLELRPIYRKAPAAPTTTSVNARTKAGSINLPFWDDFSFTPLDDPNDTTSNYPLSSLWEFSNSTWISAWAGINPPTINMATFDGLDSIGRSYSDQPLDNGFRDKLVSKPINLGGNPPNVFLSFFYQWQGNGEAPDKDDFLQLEFLNKGTKDTAWVPMITIYPKASMQRDVFYDTIIQVKNVNDEVYLYDGFQFRFRAYGRESGPFDTWNVDYVYLNAGRSLLDVTFPDIAFSATHGPLFDRYHSVPITHFRKAPVVDTVTFTMFTLESIVARGYSVEGTFTNYIDEAKTVDKVTVSEIVSITPYLQDGEFLTVKTNDVPDTTSDVLFNPLADSIIIDYKTRLTTDDPGNADNTFPINFAANDTIFKRYYLKDFYAYDDGSADYSAVLASPGNRIAIAFELLGEENEKLVGIDIHCPSFGIPTNGAVVSFEVYNDNNGMPGTRIYNLPSRPVQALGPNKFLRIPIASSEDLFVDKRFYIGWAAPAGPLFHVGIDYSNDTSDKVFVKNNSATDWRAENHIKGSFMIRPVFGAGADNPTGIEGALAGVSLYPNPSGGEFYLEGRADVVSIIDMKGQVVPFEVSPEGERKRISLRQTSPGIYLVRLQQGRLSGVQKIIVR